ncbi:alpha/beta hydrolase [Candidatus Acetothermia bacterium]|nr:alpha/beta hydrolase [Candidatus Acetothermia bacterium]MBI3643344.1 alpha/beta hydrolase [Candidatus Acetothermia bacterium]
MPMQAEMTPMEMQSHMLVVSETPRVQLHVIESGPRNATMTIVFVHGYGGWATQWLAQMECFDTQTRVISIDLRGHGKSDRPRSTYSSDELLGDLEKAFQLLNIKKPFVLVGHSFGAALVAEYAVRHPGDVERLVLLNASTSYSVNALLRLPLLLPDWLIDGVLNIINKQTLVYAAPSFVLKALYWDALSQWNASEYFSKITIPALVISPTGDPVFSQQEMDEVAQMIPGSKLIKIKVSTHMTMMRRPGEVNQAMAQFLGLSGC